MASPLPGATTGKPGSATKPLLRDVAEGRTIGDTTTLADDAALADLSQARRR